MGRLRAYLKNEDCIIHGSAKHPNPIVEVITLHREGKVRALSK